MARAAPSAASRLFANLNKKEVKLPPKWEELAAKESRGKYDVRDMTIKVTNEQMIMKPIYTKEDWSP
jgi:hypothetical protein